MGRRREELAGVGRGRRLLRLLGLVRVGVDRRRGREAEGLRIDGEAVRDWVRNSAVL